jgi:hypothetical protein
LVVTLSARHDVREGVGRKIPMICNLGLIRCAADRSYNHLISFILRFSVRFCTDRVVTPLSPNLLLIRSGPLPGARPVADGRSFYRFPRYGPRRPAAATAGRGEEKTSSHGARPDHRGQRLDEACATTPIFSNIDEPAGGRMFSGSTTWPLPRMTSKRPARRRSGSSSALAPRCHSFDGVLQGPLKHFPL